MKFIILIAKYSQKLKCLMVMSETLKSAQCFKCYVFTEYFALEFYRNNF